MTVLLTLGAFALGYYIGKRVGVARTMLALQDIIDDLHRIEKSFKQWNEDKL